MVNRGATAALGHCAEFCKEKDANSEVRSVELAYNHLSYVIEYQSVGSAGGVVLPSSACL